MNVLGPLPIVMIVMAFIAAILLGAFIKIRISKNIKRSRGELENNSGEININYLVGPYKEMQWQFPISLSLVDRVACQNEFELYFSSQCTIQTEKSLMFMNGTCYFEIRIIDFLNSNIIIGLAPKVQTHCDIPGLIDGSIGLNSNSGSILVSQNNVKNNVKNNEPLSKGDVIGVMIRRGIHTQVTYSLNGELLGDLLIMCRPNLILYPTIYSSGIAHVEFNFGTSPFKLIQANLTRYGLDTPESLSVPPPSYSLV